MAGQFWEEALQPHSAALFDEDIELPADWIGPWRSTLRLRVRCSTQGESTSGSLLAISSHARFAGVWHVLEVVEELGKHVLVCLVPQDRWEPNDGGLALPTFDLDWMPSGSGPVDANLCACAVGSVESAPRVRVAPRLTWHARCTIYALSAIDTVAQRFTADLVIELRLRRACREGDEALVTPLLHAYGFHGSMLEIMNSVSFSSGPERWITFGTPSTTRRGPQGLSRTRDYSMKMRAAGDFSEQYELERFPFDAQDVSILLTLNMSTARAQLADNVDYPSLFLHKGFALSGIFTPTAEAIVAVETMHSEPGESVTGTLYPRMRFSVPLARKYGYFMNNIIVPVGAITLMAPLSAATEPDGVRMGTGDRMAYSVTLLLTAVAYKFVIASSLPQVSYLTLVDSYTLVCFGFMWLNLLESALWPTCGYVVDAATGEVRERFSEWWYLVAYVAAFALYNLYFAYGVHGVLAQREAGRGKPRHAATIAATTSLTT